MRTNREKFSLPRVLLVIGTLLLLCGALGACTQTQVRGQYDLVIGGTHH